MRWWTIALTVILSVGPSVATALMKYPRTEGWGANLKMLLDMFSVLAHDDSPHTLKLPLTTSKPPGSVPIEPVLLPPEVTP